MVQKRSCFLDENILPFFPVDYYIINFGLFGNAIELPRR
jgi:hypothetical protein